MRIITKLAELSGQVSSAVHRCDLSFFLKEPGLDDRWRNRNGEMRRKRNNTHAGTLSKHYSEFDQDGYPLDSPSPKGLCFAGRFPGLWVNDLEAGQRINGDGLLREAKEQRSPAAR